MIERESPPKCFGKNDDDGKPLWDPKVPACAGGLDPLWADPDTGSHVRQRCDFFNPCGARAQAARQHQLIPQNQLIRQATPMQQVPAANQATQLGQLMRQVSELQQVVQNQNAQLQAARQGLPMMGALQPVQPLQMMAVEYRMPSYLTVPEPRTRSSSVWTLLGREVARSMLKSAGHTMANFWDTTPFGPEEEKK
jgi:hypothetical protein